MNIYKTNNVDLLGTLVNADESGIIAYADQIYDSNSKESVQERIDSLEDKVTKVEETIPSQLIWD